MLLISIQLYAFRKIFFLVTALFGFSSAICLADSLFMSLRSAPPNRQDRAPLLSLASGTAAASRQTCQLPSQQSAVGPWNGWVLVTRRIVGSPNEI
jgi:hypothetical protein